MNRTVYMDIARHPNNQMSYERLLGVLAEEVTAEFTRRNSSTVIALPAAHVPGMRFAPIVRLK